MAMFLFNTMHFRAPGAATIEKLLETPMKTDYWKEIYLNMHRNIYSHPEYITPSNISQLGNCGFFFICLDKGNIKEKIIYRLEESKISFIDVGMGLEIVDNSLRGMLRITTSTENKREHVREKDRISFTDDDDDDDYSKNIQIADLNSLNATLAVIKWKKLCGFYLDLEHENNCTYTLDVNMLWSEDNDS